MFEEERAGGETRAGGVGGGGREKRGVCWEGGKGRISPSLLSSFPSALRRKEKMDDWGRVRSIFSIGFSRSSGIEIEKVLFVFVPDRKQLVFITKKHFSTTSVLFVCLFQFWVFS